MTGILAPYEIVKPEDDIVAFALRPRATFSPVGPTNHICPHTQSVTVYYVDI